MPNNSLTKNCCVLSQVRRLFCKRPRIGPQFASVVILTAICILYCYGALRAPFFGGVDTLSNLLPIAQYRHSIISEGKFPWYTTLWYGGRYQWANPLWNFLYLPATAVWLIFPLGWATKIVICGHLLFSLLAGRYLARSLIKNEVQSVALALLFTAPVTPALMAGHLEKVMAWPWMLLGLSYLLDARRSHFRRGLLAGVCLGVIALTGANYYVLYTAILYGLIGLSIVSERVLMGFMGGMTIGLLHLPTVLYLIGKSRGNAVESIPLHSSSITRVFSNLFWGGKVDMWRWEGISIIGLPTALIFVACLAQFLTSVLSSRPDSETADQNRRTKMAILIAGGILLLFTTGVAYKGHHLLDTFRVPSRATAFLAVTILLFICLCAGESYSLRGRKIILALMAASVIHVAVICWWMRPQGEDYWIGNSGAIQLADFLSVRGAQSVWINANGAEEWLTESTEDMLIDLALNMRGIGLPNVYYGDMNQSVPVKGNLCGGYSFDYLLVDHSYGHPAEFGLRSDMSGGTTVDKIPASQLEYLTTRKVANRSWDVYQVRCLKSSPPTK